MLLGGLAPKPQLGMCRPRQRQGCASRDSSKPWFLRSSLSLHSPLESTQHVTPRGQRKQAKRLGKHALREDAGGAHSQAIAADSPAASSNSASPGSIPHGYFGTLFEVHQRQATTLFYAMPWVGVVIVCYPILLCAQLCLTSLTYSTMSLDIAEMSLPSAMIC